MIGEISIAGILVPALLALAVLALILTALLTRLLAVLSAYRFIVYRPLVDITLFIFILGLLVLLSAPYGPSTS